VLYDDGGVVCDDKALVIRRYYVWEVRPLQLERSAESLSKGHGDPSRTTYVGHEPSVFVSTDTAYEAVAVGGKSIDLGLKVIDFERDAPQPEFVGHGAW
jgi:hypothetical protein